MLWPNEAKNAIANSFYDKTIEVLSSQTQLDAEGGIIRGTQSVTSTFRGNVRFVNLGELQAELGLVEAVDISITCNVDTPIAVDGLFRYDNKIYKATSVIPADSHLTIVGQKWVSV